MATAFFLVGATDCKSCDRNPYTPFSLDAGPTTSGSATTPSVVTSAFAPITAASCKGTEFPLNPGRAIAPGDKAFVSCLPLDANSDGMLDLVAWIETPGHGPGELWFVRGGDAAGSGTTLAKAPSDVGDSDCKRDVKLAQIGHSTVVAELVAKCPAQKTHEWFAVVRLHGAGDKRDPELRLDGRLRPAASGETVTLAMKADDRDNDGTDDLGIEVTLDGMGEPFEASGKVTLPLLFVDRPAGFARDPSEPEATLGKLGQQLVARAKGKKTASEVVGSAAQLLRAASMVCDDVGEPLVTTSAGANRCGDPRFAADAVFATGVAGVTLNDPAQALAASSALGELKGDPQKRGKELDSFLSKLAPVTEVSVVKRISAKLADAAPLGPITFDADGNLLLVTDAGVTKIAATDLSESKSEAVAWPRTMAWQLSGTEFAVTGATRKCPDGPAVRARLFGGPIVTPVPSLAAIIPRPLAAHACKDTDLSLEPLVTQGQGAVVAIGTDIFRVESSGSTVIAKRAALPDDKAPPSLPGAGRAPDGSAIALPVGPDSPDVLVVTAKGSRRFRSDDLKGASLCVPRQGGSRIACIVKGSTLIADPR